MFDINSSEIKTNSSCRLRELIKNWLKIYQCYLFYLLKKVDQFIYDNNLLENVSFKKIILGFDPLNFVRHLKVLSSANLKEIKR